MVGANDWLIAIYEYKDVCSVVILGRIKTPKLQCIEKCFPPPPTKLSVSHMIEQYRKSTEIRFQSSRQRFILQTQKFVCYYMLLYVNQHRSECKLEIHIKDFFLFSRWAVSLFFQEHAVFYHLPTNQLFSWLCGLRQSLEPLCWIIFLHLKPLSFIFYFFAIIIRGGNGGSHCVMNSLPNYALSTDLIDWSTCFSNTDYY